MLISLTHRLQQRSVMIPINEICGDLPLGKAYGEKRSIFPMKAAKAIKIAGRDFEAKAQA